MTHQSKQTARDLHHLSMMEKWHLLRSPIAFNSSWIARKLPLEMANNLQLDAKNNDFI